MKREEETTDEDLIALACERVSGSISPRRAIEILLERHYAWVVGYCRTSLWNTSDAYDVAQKIMLDVTRGLRSFRQESAFRTWLYTIARRHIRRERTRNWLRGKKEISVAQEKLNNFTAGDTGGLSTESVRAVQKFVHTLHGRQREAVMLHYFEDRSVEEVAQCLGCTAGSVKVHLSRAREKLRAKLEADEK